MSCKPRARSLLLLAFSCSGLSSAEHSGTRGLGDSGLTAILQRVYGQFILLYKAHAVVSWLACT